MTMPPFTPRNVAKFVAKAFVAQKAADITEDILDDYTPIDTDSTTVGIGCKVVGWYVSEKFEPITDAIVDKTADFVAAKRAKRQDKKTETK